MTHLLQKEIFLKKLTAITYVPSSYNISNKFLALIIRYKVA